MCLWKTSFTFNLLTMEYADSNRHYEMPPGFRFSPSDHELIKKYLQPKVEGRFIPPGIIPEVEVNSYHPKQLHEKRAIKAVEEAYFFTRRRWKNPTGNCPDRAVGSEAAPHGFWKATAGKTNIELGGDIIGKKQSLVYFTGSHSRSTRTHWIMYEFTLPTTPSTRNETLSDVWVLCKIYEAPVRNQTSDMQSSPPSMNSYNLAMSTTLRDNVEPGAALGTGSPLGPLSFASDDRALLGRTFRG